MDAMLLHGMPIDFVMLKSAIAQCIHASLIMTSVCL